MQIVVFIHDLKENKKDTRKTVKNSIMRIFRCDLIAVKGQFAKIKLSLI